MFSSVATYSSTPIDIPAHSLILHFFVHLLEHKSGKSTSRYGDLPVGHPLYHPSGTGFNCLNLIIHLLRQFECGSGLEERALAHFEPFWVEDPWSILVYAGETGDVSLARRAIELFGDLGGLRGPDFWTVNPNTMDPKQAERLPLGWFMGYCRAWNEQTKVSRPYFPVCQPT